MFSNLTNRLKVKIRRDGTKSSGVEEIENNRVRAETAAKLALHSAAENPNTATGRKLSKLGVQLQEQSISYKQTEEEHHRAVNLAQQKDKEKKRKKQKVEDEQKQKRKEKYILDEAKESTAILMPDDFPQTEFTEKKFQQTLYEIPHSPKVKFKEKEVEDVVEQAREDADKAKEEFSQMYDDSASMIDDKKSNKGEIKKREKRMENEVDKATRQQSPEITALEHIWKAAERMFNWSSDNKVKVKTNQNDDNPNQLETQTDVIIESTSKPVCKSLW